MTVTTRGPRFDSRRIVSRRLCGQVRATCDARSRLCYESVSACRNGKKLEQAKVSRPQGAIGIDIL